MDQTIQYATESFLRDELAKATLRISSLEESYARANEMSNKNYSAYQSLVQAMQEWTLEALDNDAITNTQAEEIAEICGFELTREVEAEVTVTYSITLQVPAGEDAESIVNDIDFETIQYNDDYVSYLSATVDRVDI